jgi:hypothetical protein
MIFSSGPDQLPQEYLSPRATAYLVGYLEIIEGNRVL